MGKHRFIAGRLSLLALAVATGAPAMAQQIPDQGKAPIRKREIVVTAQRRAESRQDVGIAIAAFSGTEPKAQRRVQPRHRPADAGVHLSGNVGGQNSQFTIRGVTQNDFNDAIEAPVAVYVDDGYIPNMQGQTFGMFDLERVEVLKGPQGTMFGRNATGGLVHYVVNKPKDKLEATFDATYGRFNQVKLESAINLPINDKVALRLSGYFDRYDPIYKNIYPSGAAGGVPLNLGGTTTPCCQNEATTTRWPGGCSFS
jgi:iron complex outermembrane receptor protein